MPRSKRDKKISLTKTKKKGLVMKQHIIEDIQNCCNNFPNIFLFSIENMRNNKLKEIRNEWKPSRFFFGKNRVVRLGLAKMIEEDESTKADVEKLIGALQGQCGLLFTNSSERETVEWFESYSAVEFARSGFKTPETIKLPAGPMEEFSHAIEPHLRSLGMPTQLEKGIVTLYKEYTVCKKGQVLTPEQAKILKLVGKPLAEFRLVLECCFIKGKGYKRLNQGKKKTAAVSEDEGVEEDESDGKEMEQD